MGWDEVPVKARYLKLVHRSTSDDPLMQNGNLLLGKEWKLETPVTAYALEITQPYWLEVMTSFSPGSYPKKFATPDDAIAAGFSLDKKAPRHVRRAADVTFLVDVGEFSSPDYVDPDGNHWCRVRYTFSKTGFDTVKPMVNAVAAVSDEMDPRSVKWNLTVVQKKSGPNTWLAVEPKNQGPTDEEFMAWLNETSGLHTFTPIRKSTRSESQPD